MAEQACAFAGRVEGAVAATERHARWMEALRAAGIWTGIRKTLVCPRRSSAKRRTARTGMAMVIAGFLDACRFVRSWMFHRDEISRLRGRCRVLRTRTVYATSAPRETVLGPVILTASPRRCAGASSFTVRRCVTWPPRLRTHFHTVGSEAVWVDRPSLSASDVLSVTRGLAIDTEAGSCWHAAGTATCTPVSRRCTVVSRRLDAL